MLKLTKCFSESHIFNLQGDAHTKNAIFLYKQYFAAHVMEICLTIQNKSTACSCFLPPFLPQTVTVQGGGASTDSAVVCLCSANDDQ